MPKTIKVRLSTRSIDAAIKELEEYEKKVKNAAEFIANGLSQIGYTVAVTVMSGHVWSGETIESLEVVHVEQGKYILRAASKALLFFEFGAGVRYGGGHPLAGELGMGPGTYPGQTHADDPNGWWFPTDDPRLIVSVDKNGQGWAHSYGNPPYMPFYQADVAIRENILRLAKEALR